MSIFYRANFRPKKHLSSSRGIIAFAWVLALILIATPVVPGYAQNNDDGLTPRQADDVIKLLRKYMSDHPEDIINALESYATREKLAQEGEVRRTLADARPEIENDKGSFVAGNLDGDISVVEFFDYRCSYCKRVHDTVQKLVKEDGKVRLVYKEFPILGPDSAIASRAALASRRQDKYLPYHNALMSARGSLNRDRIFEIAGDVGLDVEQLEKDMKDPEIEKIISRNHALALRLDISGTPAFVIGDEIIAGAAELGHFKKLVSLARTGCATC